MDDIIEYAEAIMGENYTEQLIRQNATSQTKLKRLALIAGLSVMITATFAIPMLFPLTFAYVLFLIYIWKRFNLEFEYIYYNGDIDIDVIKGMIKRKRLFSVNVKTLEVMAPTGHIELQQYNKLKTYDCSTNTGNPTFEMVFMKGERKVKVIFEPKEAIVQGMRMFAPRKVFLK